jgi:hypothetical protein
MNNFFKSHVICRKLKEYTVVIIKSLVIYFQKVQHAAGIHILHIYNHIVSIETIIIIIKVFYLCYNIWRNGRPDNENQSFTLAKLSLTGLE